MSKKTDPVVQPTPMVKGDRAQHVLTGEIVTVDHLIIGTTGVYVVKGRTEIFRATEMELIRIPRDKWGKYPKGK